MERILLELIKSYKQSIGFTKIKETNERISKKELLQEKGNEKGLKTKSKQRKNRETEGERGKRKKGRAKRKERREKCNDHKFFQATFTIRQMAPQHSPPKEEQEYWPHAKNDVQTNLPI